MNQAEQDTARQPEQRLVAAAYAVCRRIARREAKNFYWAFRALPAEKSDAMCAVYAFMRKADDLADDESLSVEERRLRMAAWLGAWRRWNAGDWNAGDWNADDRNAASAAGVSADTTSVFRALKHTQHRFKIEDALLEELVRGTTMDLEEAPAGVSLVQLADGRAFQVYATFGGLYRYCYLVASVVGLVCIRIFGYSDAAAEGLAEELGVAFQLTNILRDVREDAERGRIYLPMEDMAGAGASFEELLRATAGAPLTDPVRHLLVHEAERAQAYYGAAPRLLPLIDPDARAALWVMFTIYHELLGKIEAAGFRVFDRRVRVSTPRKLWILLRGFRMSRRLRRQP